MEIHGTVRDILQNKSGELWTTTPNNTVYEAIGLMGEKNIGAVIVVDHGEVVGVLSERDYSRKVVLQGRTSRDTLVGEILSRPVLTVRRKDSIEKCMQLMTANRIRHLPVVDGTGAMIGMISIGDLVRAVIEEQQETIEQLERFIAG